MIVPEDNARRNRVVDTHRGGVGGQDHPLAAADFGEKRKLAAEGCVTCCGYCTLAGGAESGHIELPGDVRTFDTRRQTITQTRLFLVGRVALRVNMIE